jgi:hypothetical protein
MKRSMSSHCITHFTLSRLLEIASPGLASAIPRLPIELAATVNQQCVDELQALLSEKNGFYAFESALHVFSTADRRGFVGLEAWNDATGWKRFYNCVAAPVLYFAEDLFACQFGISRDGIYRLTPETGEFVPHSASLASWAERVLSHYNSETGWELARAWQSKHGALPDGHRLLPKIPSVLGGDYDVDNLIAVRGDVAMEKLGNLYHQIATLSDGATVTVKDWV